MSKTVSETVTESKPKVVFVTETVNCLECDAQVQMVWPASKDAKLLSCSQCAAERNLVLTASSARAAAKTAHLAEFDAAKKAYWTKLHKAAETQYEDDGVTELRERRVI